jgi:UDP-N-acetylglucosamine acyltransferase
LPPFCLFNGQPAAFAGLNTIALKRAGVTSDTINSLKHVSKLFYQDKLSTDSIKDLMRQEPTWGNDPRVLAFVTFIEQSTRGVSKRTLLDI